MGGQRISTTRSPFGGEGAGDWGQGCPTYRFAMALICIKVFADVPVWLTVVPCAIECWQSDGQGLFHPHVV